jgi:aerobic-type carbon monoxide dehydrogenase small subunit (CoxS/CutS family)
MTAADTSSPTDSMEVEVELNGRDIRARVSPRRLLADFLREDCGQTGTNLGCEQGICGSCTVLVDGVAVRSCLMFAVQAEGTSITTVEALSSSEGLSPLQQAFWDRHALQCGFCTSGILMSATALLNEVPQPSEEQILETLAGHICRCTGYESIVDAIRDVAQQRP